MDNALLVFLATVVRRFLVNAAQNLWDGLWAEICKAVAKAEQKWEESGRGAEKKEWAMDQIMSYINENADLGFIQRQIVRLFVSRVIDAIIETFNEEIGKDWGEICKEAAENIAGWIPFID